MIGVIVQCYRMELWIGADPENQKEGAEKNGRHSVTLLIPTTQP